MSEPVDGNEDRSAVPSRPAPDLPDLNLGEVARAEVARDLNLGEVARDLTQVEVARDLNLRDLNLGEVARDLNLGEVARDLNLGEVARDLNLGAAPPRRGRDDATLTGPVTPTAADVTADLNLGEAAPDVTADLNLGEAARLNLGEEEPNGGAAARAAPSQIPPSLHARFEDFHLLGRGGMGVVYRAWDLRLGRRVAIKLVSAGAQVDGTFLREARSQARLRHENACEVHEAGVADHVPYIVMRYIDGPSLQEARDNLPLEEKVRIVRTIAAVLHEAHRLGLVHRDVKPSNIMLERGEDGAYRPYLMDFGIAREVGESGPTLTGALLGTPAYMAPEQAAGRVRALDRRTDVYGLGATLYAVLAGRPPFVGGTVMDLLRQVLETEATPLGALDRDIPQDLDAVVMRCLEKEPGARYESARALGDDLQRFLDGDPVLARRASLARRLARKARRHRAAVAGVAALLLAALVVTGLLVRSRRAAAEQAALARELGETVGETVKEMELFLRAAHAMPLHDVERERDVVRARLAAVEARMATAGELGRGPGEYALGRGLLALQEPRAALEHLRAAERAGYRSPGLDYAAGVALSELYRRGLEETRRIQNPAQREARIAALEAEYKAPAVQHLRAALGGAIEAPAYVEGLLAFAEGRHEEALEKARSAFAEAPWLHEAKKLEGDVLFTVGSRHRHDAAAFDFEKMKDPFDHAAEAYRIAADHGRSDPSVHAAECELWTQFMNAAGMHGDSMRPSFERAREACGRAIGASPRSPEAYVKLAWVHNCFAWWIAIGMQNSEDAEAALREASARADEALRRSPDDAMARYVAASVFRARAYHANLTGREQGEALERAIQGYEAALEREPDFAWALNELCAVHAERGRYLSLRGQDPGGSFERARARCDRALALDPGFGHARTSRLSLDLYEVEHLLRIGRSPDEVVQRTHGLIDTLLHHDPAWNWAPYWRVWLDHALAMHALDAGGDPGPALSRATASAREMAPGAVAFPESLRATLAILEARVLIARGEDPTAPIRVARAALDRKLSEAPWDVADRVRRAEVEVLAFQWSAARGRPDPARLDAALASLSHLLDEPRAEPQLYALLAELHEARAALRADRREDAAADLAEGLRHAEAALGMNPRSDRALAAQGKLWLLRAARAPDAAARREAARRGAAALEAAIQANPLRARTVGARLVEAQRLAGQAPAPAAP
ncbi:protein kinase [Sorangium cellulosum]|uniref:Protein kinase n=1 Tax=Sorangium cellulosum TaxID=56 RepID=A0A4P2Q4L1_SORCE|nr:serine/threonine-protein kinase [Sorangium cellulosum]AUX24334.1 protein kinase [Sorangium cellulosum]